MEICLRVNRSMVEHVTLTPFLYLYISGTCLTFSFLFNRMKEDVKVLSCAKIGERQFPIFGSIEEPLFKAKDVADVLNLTNVSDMISRVDGDEVTKLNLGGLQGETWFLTEAGLYEVFFQSRKPVAREFKKIVKGILRELRIKGEVSVGKTHSLSIKRVSKTKVEAAMALIKGADEIFSLDAVSKQRMFNDFAKEYDLPLLPYVAAPNGSRDSLTNLLKAHGVTMSAREVNKRLVNAGILSISTRTKSNGKTATYPVVTEIGKVYADNYQNEHSPKQTQPLYFTNRFGELLASVGIM